MSPKTTKKTEYTLASTDLLDAYTDFTLSRQAMLVSPGTLRWYGFTAGRFCTWLEGQGITRPDEVTARYVRAYLAELAPSLKDTTLHGQARAVKTLLRFWHDEGYLPRPVRFDMPKLAEKRLPVLDGEELRRVIDACKTSRDKALVMFLADTGVRMAELLALRWGDLDMQTGAVKVLRGKGGKYRVTFCGAKTRRALLKYRRELTDRDQDGRIFPLTANGLRSALLRIGERVPRVDGARAGIHLTAHTLRRTFATLARRGGMDVVMLQALLGHSTAEMTAHYIRWVNDDLEEAHRRASPVDNLPI